MNRYVTPQAFKVALETRLRRNAQAGGVALSRVRQLCIFDRWLAWMVLELGDRFVLKGGVALELRLTQARTTRDVDVRLSGRTTHLLSQLEGVAVRDTGDHLSFAVGPDRHHPAIQGDGVIYQGQRFRVQAHLAGKPYGDPFGLDVAHGDPILRAPDQVTGGDWLDFVGIAPAVVPVIPRESHVAEKLHAYTLPRNRENSRIKDLPDLALLACTGSFLAADVRQAIRQTFTFRKTHPVPAQLPSPPPAWADAYRTMARDDDLPWPLLDAVVKAARRFLDPVLGDSDGTWDPTRSSWSRQDSATTPG